MKYIVIFENGYCGCSETHYLIADSPEQIDSFCQEGLCEYINSYDYLAQNTWEEHEERDEDEDFFESQEYEDFRQNCYYEYFELTPELTEEYDVNEDTEWEDIR